MAKKKLFKSKGNFTIKRLHQSGSYGNIYERDYTTIVKSLSNPGGQIPYGNTPTFKLTIRNGVKNVGEWAFAYCNMSDLVLPNGLDILLRPFLSAPTDCEDTISLFFSIEIVTSVASSLRRKMKFLPS